MGMTMTEKEPKIVVKGTFWTLEIEVYSIFPL
jgi:hypothetical protein